MEVSDMELVAYLIDGAQIELRAGQKRRDWMDASPQRYAYRCLPLSMANTHGWEILNPLSFEAVWDGGKGPEAICITPQEEIEGGMPVQSRFGGGILTFEHRVIFKTPTGCNLWVSGSPNHFKDGAQPLSALVEADWMPYFFTMNWKLTRPNHPVRFEKGEPYCFFFPVSRGLPEQMDPRVMSVADEPELQEQFKRAFHKRTFLEMIQRIKGTERPTVVNDRALRYQSWYSRGAYPDGAGHFSEHQTVLNLKPFAPSPLEDESD